MNGSRGDTERFDDCGRDRVERLLDNYRKELRALRQHLAEAEQRADEILDRLACLGGTRSSDAPPNNEFVRLPAGAGK